MYSCIICGTYIFFFLFYSFGCMDYQFFYYYGDEVIRNISVSLIHIILKITEPLYKYDIRL